MSSPTDARKAKFRQTITEIENALFHGSRREARALLQDLFHRKIDREFLWEVGSLLRLADFSEKAVQLLHKYVRPPEGMRDLSTPHEKAVYAMSLAELGALSEARKILDELDPEKLPRVYFYKAFTYIRSWDWNAAVPLLEANSKHPKVDDYSRLAALVWLGGALTMGREDHARSQRLLERALTETRPDFRRFLRKHALRFLSQNYLYQRNFKAALEAVRELDELARLDHDQQFVLTSQLWRSAVEFAGHGTARRREGASRLTSELRKIASGFRELKLWEEARETDLLLALLLHDDDLLVRLYVGTPYGAFRTRLRAALKDKSKIPLHYDWPLGSEKPGSHVVDLANGQNTFGAAYLKEGQIQQRLLQVLASDFYRPMKVPEVHERLYPGDYFNPESSPDRVHQAMRRLRAWITKAKLPVLIHEDLGFYSLDTSEPLSFRVSVLEETEARPKVGVKLMQYLARVEEKYGEKQFAATDFARALRISHPSAIRFLRTACEGGLLERQGKGPATKYHFKR